MEKKFHLVEGTKGNMMKEIETLRNRFHMHPPKPKLHVIVIENMKSKEKYVTVTAHTDVYEIMEYLYETFKDFIGTYEFIKSYYEGTFFDKYKLTFEKSFSVNEERDVKDYIKMLNRRFAAEKQKDDKQ